MPAQCRPQEKVLELPQSELCWPHVITMEQLEILADRNNHEAVFPLSPFPRWVFFVLTLG